MLLFDGPTTCFGLYKSSSGKLFIFKCIYNNCRQKYVHIYEFKTLRYQLKYYYNVWNVKVILTFYSLLVT
jgi:hypothetical protein